MYTWQVAQRVVQTRVPQTRTDVVRLLIKQRAELNMFNADGQTPLSVAAAAGNLKHMRLLLDHGAAVKASMIGHRLIGS